MATKEAKETDTKGQSKYIRSRGMRFPNTPEVITKRIRRMLLTNNYEPSQCCSNWPTSH